ncbi:MAG: InlB B-repeat-containing protein [Bacteroidaceae bacterium]|nr:InlB B-repeat-containing protein [Bacteroidaceae bacterium]
MKKTLSLVRAGLMLLAMFATTAWAQSTDPLIGGYTATGGTLGLISENYAFLFDGDKTTKWCVTDCNFEDDNVMYVEFHTDIPFVPTSYVMTTGSDCADNPGRNPSTWEILAKLNPDGGWAPIAHVRDDNVLQDVNSQDYEFELSNHETAFKYFRLEIKGVKSGNIFQLAEFQFRGHQHVTDLSTITENFVAPDGEILTGTLDTGQHPVKISIADGARVTLDGATIHGVNLASCPWAGLTCEGNGTLILAEGTTSEIEGFHDNYPGIFVPAGKTLTIRGDGSLIAYCYNSIHYIGGFGAGIGGGARIPDCGNINIEGGNIKAYGNGSAAGIGGGVGKACGDITISGGTVYAKGGTRAPGIGCGETYYEGDVPGSCGNITITNGVTSVTALSTTGNNSIGTGGGGTCGTVTIGDVVTGIIGQTPFYTFPYTVAFDAGGGTGEMPEMSFMYNIAKELNLINFTRDDYVFAKWSTEADGSGTTYENGQNVSNVVSEPGTNATLHAQWQQCTMTYGTPYIMTQERYVPYVTFTNTFDEESVGKYQPWFLPFDYTITAEDTQSFRFFKIYMIANAPKPGEGSADEMWIFLTRLNEGDVLNANMPYVYKPIQAATDYKFTVVGTNLMPKNDDVLITMQTVDDTYTISGIYANREVNSYWYDIYCFNDNGSLSFMHDWGLTTPSLQWALRKQRKQGGTPSYAPEIRFFGEEGDDPDGIVNVCSDAITADKTSWFTLDGRKLSGKPGTKGIYIKGSKKVLY